MYFVVVLDTVDDLNQSFDCDIKYLGEKLQNSFHYKWFNTHFFGKKYLMNGYQGTYYLKK